MLRGRVCLSRLLLLTSHWLSVSCWLLVGLGLSVGICHGHVWLITCGSCSRLSNRSFDLGLIVLHSVFEKEVGGELLVLVACQVGLQASMPRETERLQALNGLHLLLSHLDLARAGSCGSRTTLRGTGLAATHAAHRRHTAAAHTTEVGITAHDHVHESHWVLLDGSIDLGIVLLKASHELLVKLGVLTHALRHVCKLRVRHQAHQLGVWRTHSHATTWHATGARLSRTWILVTVVGETFITACRDAIEVDSLEK